MRSRLSNWPAIGFVACVTLIFLLLGIASSTRLQQRDNQQAKRQFKQEASLAASLIAPALGSLPASQDATARQISAATGADVSIVAPDGSVLDDSGPTTTADAANDPSIAGALAGNTEVFSRGDSQTGQRTWFALAPVKSGNQVVAVVRLSESGHAFNAGFANDRTFEILTLVSAEFAVLIITIVFGRLAMRPLERIVSMTRMVSRGDLGARASVEQRSEFADVAIAFNEMADELESTFNTIDLESRRLESVVEHLADGIVIVDADGRVGLMNLAAEKLLGLMRSRSIGRTYAEVLRDYELAAVVREGRAIPEAGSAPVTKIVEVGMPRRWVQAFSYPIPSDDTPVVLVVLRDVTEFRRTEAVRRDFVANVSHDLRTPIASLKALVETLVDGALEDPSVSRDFLSRMEVEVVVLARLVE
ncbi:MAG TPA: histidine kinase dimerization/phospho-acceptor domain-containing protein, partial [Nitrolancea sp.]|nr:histidine kinase dimerization/phospho-acceptor domain-containing protein [Nitrolancea sp.]